MSVVAELREMFESKFKLENPAIHPSDLSKIKTDVYLEKFLTHNDNDLKAAFQMLWNTLLWRQSFDVNSINESNINMDYIQEGAFFPFGYDRDGCRVFILFSKMHKKSEKNIEELKRCLVYWFERIDREETHDGKKITLFFNTEGAGISNIDMDLIKFIISLFTDYYPNFLNHVLCYEVPLILSATFTIIKQLLPKQMKSKMILVKKSNIQEYISPDQGLISCGGTNAYEFKFVPQNN